jgi:hypothetical protein
MGGVDASAWAGHLAVTLSAVGAGDTAHAVGTTIRAGSGGSSIVGTEGADNIFLGAGKDTVAFDTSIDATTKTDAIFNFTAGAGKDVLDIASTVTTLDAVLSANPAATAVGSGEIVRLVDIAGGDDLTTVAGLVNALGAGEYSNVDIADGSHVTVLTAASTQATTFYVFDINDTGSDGITAADVKLVGIVNTTGGTLGSLVLGNFT